jgi:hypothetical protein
VRSAEPWTNRRVHLRSSRARRAVGYDPDRLAGVAGRWYPHARRGHMPESNTTPRARCRLLCDPEAGGSCCPSLHDASSFMRRSSIPASRTAMIAAIVVSHRPSPTRSPRCSQERSD